MSQKSRPLVEHALPKDAQVQLEAAAQSAAIRKRLAEIEEMPVSALQDLYYELHGRATRARNRTWLIKRLSYQIQELLTGLTLSAKAKERVAKLNAEHPMRLRSKARSASQSSTAQPLTAQPSTPQQAREYIQELERDVTQSLSASVKALAPPEPKPRDPRLPPIGTVIRRLHNDQIHEVHVLDDGFEYQGRHYASLSQIAKQVTGTNWNGFLWAGLSKRKRKTSEHADQREQGRASDDVPPPSEAS